MDRRTIVAIDCGQAVTQAALFESVGLGLRLLGVATAPTTAGEPQAGLGCGVTAALRQLEARTDRPLLDGQSRPLAPGSAPSAPDAWMLTTDSRGSVRVTVAGVIDDISGQSALKAAMGAGASVADLLAINDGRLDHDRARDLRTSPVDLVLLAGGVDEGLYSGGGGRQVVHMARTIALAHPRPRYDPRSKITVIFAGSTEARPDVAAHLGPVADIIWADNVRPDLGLENTSGARQAVLEAFRSTVVPRDPDYRGLGVFAGLAELTPTGMAVSGAAELLAGVWKSDVLFADIGELATSIYTVIERQVNRTTTDEAGPSRGGGAPDAAGLAEGVETWLPMDCPRETVANVLAFQRLRPESVPMTWTELCIQQAAARERLRTALEAHRGVAALLKGIHRQRNIDEVFGAYRAVGGQSLVDLSRIKYIVATGRLVREATHPGQVMGMVMDGLQPQGLTQVMADEGYLLPHIGAMAAQDTSLAGEALGDGWLARLGLVVAPVPRERGGPLFRRFGGRLARVRIERQDGTVIRETVNYGSVKRIPLPEDETVRVTVSPERGYNVGAGHGFSHTMAGGGRLGVILDGRGRPIITPLNPARRRSRTIAWLRELGGYPEAVLGEAAQGEGS